MNELPPELDTPEFRAEWELWLAYRKERRLAKYKPIGLRRQLNALAAFGPQSAIAAIEQSMAQNYQGLFPKAVIEPAKGTGRPAKKVGWM